LAFRHPLIRSAVVELSTHDERRRAHRALAEVLDEEPERRAWHLAEATLAPDEQVASLLEEAAHLVLSRGDAVGAVARLIRAGELSLAGTDKGRRLAEAAYIVGEMTGELSSASILLDSARQADPMLGRSLHAAAAAVFVLINGEGDVDTAHRLLVGAIETSDHGYKADNAGLIEALHSLLLLCWYGGRPELWGPFYKALSRLTPQPPPHLSVLSKTFPDPVRTAVAALDEFDALARALPGERDPTKIIRMGQAAVYVDRLADSREGAWRLVRLGREGGAARRHLVALMIICLDDFPTGQWEEAQELADEGLAVCEAHDYRFFAWYFLYIQAVLSAVHGEYDISHAIADRMTRWAVPRGVRTAALFAHHPRALCALGQSDFEAAYRYATALSPAGTLAPYVPHALWVTFDLVEAAMRTNRLLEASAHVAAMIEANMAALSPRMALLQGASTAIAAPESSAVELFERALSIPGVDRWPFEMARVQLAYGERLRRSRDTTKSRQHLGAALAVFQRLGAAPWVSRASNELRATGQAPRTLGAAEPGLTPQENEIALLAAAGLTNKQIAERLYLSPRTVSAHLYRIFPKLGITSRAALRDALGTQYRPQT
jgi:DNA-binding CsgD family transcriptional regulator